MIEAHVQLYSRLTRVEAYLLWTHLWRVGLVTSPPDPTAPDGGRVGQACAQLSHAEVILSMSSRSEVIWCDIMDKLLQKPIYLCARGETGIPTVDLLGRPLPMPIGHRRGEALGTGGLQRPIIDRLQRQRKHDPRVIVWIVEKNPKLPGSAAYKRFSLYKVGMSVAEFVALGGFPRDVVHDTHEGFIRVDMP